MKLGWIGLPAAILVAHIAFAEESYLGGEMCTTCHFKQFKTWSKTKHAASFEELKEKERSDPKCVKCHTTAFGTTGGFESVKKTPDLVNIQCEACHGPGADHRDRGKKAEEGGGKLEDDPKYKMAPGNVCIGCHNPHLDHKKMKRFLRAIKKMSLPKPGVAENAKTLPYVGLSTCEKCHKEDVETWKKRKHAKAFDLLEEEHLSNPKCVACHSTGFGKKGGFTDAAKTPGLKHVQCEMCHGPGSKHVREAEAAEKAGKKLTKSDAAYNNLRNLCTKCHNPHVSHEDKH